MTRKLDQNGVDVAEDIKKIQQAISDVQSDTLRIALLGAFSDGKTSVVAGWLGKIIDGMKIDTDESSDGLDVYRPEDLPEKCEIVDTPGLFGDKMHSQDSSYGAIKFSDITKKYISEAHLIFYVVDATNPLKDSHGDIVKWVLRDLNKLSTTIFVINKMDEVADLTDSDEFDRLSKIKKENLIGKLTRFASLTQNEIVALNVVCISSNPNGRGLEFWFSKMETYEQRSRISDLKHLTNGIIDGTSRGALIRKAGIDVVADVVDKKIQQGKDEFSRLDLFLQTRKTEIERIEEDIHGGRRTITKATDALRDELDELERRLMTRARTIELSDCKAFLEDEIGYIHNQPEHTGYKLRQKIEAMCRNTFDSSESIATSIQKSIATEISATDDFINKLAGNAANGALKVLSKVGSLPLSTIKSGVFASRNALGSITGFVYKFKPWEATKMAANISKWAGPIGAGITGVLEIVDMYKQHQREKQTQELRNSVTELIKEHFFEVIKTLNNRDTLFEIFAPQLKQLQSVLDNQRNEYNAILQQCENLRSIEKEFNELKPIVLNEGDYKVY